MKPKPCFCGSCRFFGAERIKQEGYGTCRRRAPTLVDQRPLRLSRSAHEDIAVPRAAWLWVNHADYCYEFEREG